jgi:hypothetical protein
MLLFEGGDGYHKQYNEKLKKYILYKEPLFTGNIEFKKHTGVKEGSSNLPVLQNNNNTKSKDPTYDNPLKQLYQALISTTQHSAQYQIRLRFAYYLSSITKNMNNILRDIYHYADIRQDLLNKYTYDTRKISKVINQINPRNIVSFVDSFYETDMQLTLYYLDDQKDTHGFLPMLFAFLNLIDKDIVYYKHDLQDIIQVATAVGYTLESQVERPSSLVGNPTYEVVLKFKK